jgi:hypothetical protein
MAPSAKARGDEVATRLVTRPDLDVTAGQRSCDAQLPVICDLVPAVLNRNVSPPTQPDAVPAKMASPVLDLGRRTTTGNRWWSLYVKDLVKAG